MANNFLGDYLGFVYAGVHSSTYNIVRTIEGDRVESPLRPETRDTTVTIAGRDGVSFFKSDYGSLNITITFAYDQLDDKDRMNLKKWFKGKKENILVFDEEPFIEYKVKVTGSPSLSFIPFDEDDKRIYKGEGTVTFTCYEGKGRAPHRLLDFYPDPYNNKKDWGVASGISKNNGENNRFFTTGNANLYNAGLYPSPIALYIKPLKNTGYQVITYRDTSGSNSQKLVLDMSKLSVGKTYKIDSEKQLIVGGTFSSGKFTENGLIYNQAIAAGSFMIIGDNTTGTMNLSPRSKIDESLVEVLSTTKGEYTEEVFYDYYY